MKRLSNRRQRLVLLCLLTAPLILLTPLIAAGAGRGTPWPMHVIDNSLSGADGVRLDDVNGDGLPDIATGFEQGDAVRVCLHPGYAAVKNPWPALTVGNAPQTEDAFFVDLDGDGVKDVVSSGQASSRLFVHWAPSNPADYLNPAAWQTVAIPASIGHGWLFSTAMQVDGKNGIDIIGGGVDTAPVIAWFECPAGDRRNLAAWNMHVMSNVAWTMSLIPYDVDNDGDPDVIVTDRFNNAGLEGARWLENPGTGSPLQMNPWPNHFIGAQTKNPMLSVMVDLDRDGLDDLLVPEFSEGLSFFRRLDRVANSWQEYTIPKPPNTGTPKGCNVGDIDLDGRPDIVMSFANAADPLSGMVWLSYLNSPMDPGWVDHEISGPAGEKFDIVALVDLDGDGDLDVLTTEEEAPPDSRGLGVIWYENPTIQLDTDQDGVPDAQDNCPTTANAGQADSDGDHVGDACDACPNTPAGLVVDATGCPLLAQADFDRDGDVDQEDFGHLQICMTGSEVPQNDPACRDARVDADGDVDQKDFAIFQRCISGPHHSADPNCAN